MGAKGHPMEPHFKTTEETRHPIIKTTGNCICNVHVTVYMYVNTFTTKEPFYKCLCDGVSVRLPAKKEKQLIPKRHYVLGDRTSDRKYNKKK